MRGGGFKTSIGKTLRRIADKTKAFGRRVAGKAKEKAKEKLDKAKEQAKEQLAQVSQQAIDAAASNVQNVVGRAATGAKAAIGDQSGSGHGRAAALLQVESSRLGSHTQSVLDLLPVL